MVEPDDEAGRVLERVEAVAGAEAGDAEQGRDIGLGEAFAEQEDAITQFRTLWWRVPRAVLSVGYLLALVTVVLSVKVLARARYLATAVVLLGGLWLVLAVWGAGA